MGGGVGLKVGSGRAPKTVPPVLEAVENAVETPGGGGDGGGGGGGGGAGGGAGGGGVRVGGRAGLNYGWDGRGFSARPVVSHFVFFKNKERDAFPALGSPRRAEQRRRPSVTLLEAGASSQTDGLHEDNDDIRFSFFLVPPPI